MIRTLRHKCVAMPLSVTLRFPSHVTACRGAFVTRQHERGGPLRRALLFFFAVICALHVGAHVAWAQEPSPAAIPSAPSQAAPGPTPAMNAVPADADALRAQLAAEQKLRLEQQAAFEKRLAALEEAQAASEEAALLESVLATDESAALEKPEKLLLYGFMDMGLQRAWLPRTSFFREVTPTRETTFLLGNVNLYLDARPDEHWRGLVEVRFTNLPHGNETGLGGLGGEYKRTDTNVFDSSDATGLNNVRTGSIILERAYLQYSYSDKLQIRGGQWFTPWGIWNIDHGSPTLIAISLPGMILFQALPRQQTGLELLGRFNRPPYSVGYHLTVSNGRTPSLVDYTDNKAVGGRLFVKYSGKSEIQLGTTGFWGRAEDIKKDLTGIAPVTIDIKETYALTDTGFGADLSVDFGGTKLRMEGLITTRRYDPGKRQPAALEPPGYLDSDRIGYGGYVILGHRFAWLEPYLMGDFQHIPTGRGDSTAVFSGGANAHFSASSQLKIQYGYIHFFDLIAKNDGNHSRNDFQTLAARWVLAF